MRLPRNIVGFAPSMVLAINSGESVCLCIIVILKTRHNRTGFARLPTARWVKRSLNIAYPAMALVSTVLLVTHIALTVQMTSVVPLTLVLMNSWNKSRVSNS